MDSSMLIWILIAISFLTLGLLFSLWRQRREGSQASEELVQLTSSLQLANERLERELRNAINESARGGRQELIQTLGTFQQSLVQQGAEATRTQNGQMDAFAQQLALLQKTLSDTLTFQVQQLSETNARRLTEMRGTLETQLAQLQQSNTAKLDEMRQTVDEKLQTTLQARHATRPGSKNRVDFAIRLPGRSDDGEPVWLPIDAKFPNEDYERLLDAQSRADVIQADLCSKALEARVRLEAKSMTEKYVEPPYTTDFAIMFFPTEGLYAEVLRRPGLIESLQRDFRVTLAGPTTLMAMLNSLQMGFRTLALEKRSSEVWQVLGAVKTEFGKFGDVLAKVKEQTQTVLNTLDKAQTRSNVMHRALRQVEALPEGQAAGLLPHEADVSDGETSEA